MVHDDKIFTVGVFVAFYGGYQDAIVRGITDVVTQHNGRTICFAGAALNDISDFRKHWNALYDLANAQNLDGLIVLSSALGIFVTTDEVTRFCQRYAPLPIVSIGKKLAGIANVTTDGSVGLADLLNHLIEDHQHQRIAFIQGPAGDRDAQVRYQTYVDALEKHDIPLDPALLLPGNFMQDAGVDAVSLLLDERKLMPDVIVAANDSMALSAWQELAQRGFEIPKDIAIAGFDDIEDASSFSTPLSTVNQALPAQGRMAAQILIDSFLTGTPPQDRTLGSEMVIRQSCGCVPKAFFSASTRPDPIVLDDRASHVIATYRERALAEIQDLIHTSFPVVDPDNTEAMVLAFFRALQGEADTPFIPLTNQALQSSLTGLGRADLKTGVMNRWHDVLSILWEGALSFEPVNQRVLDLLHQARILVSQTAEQAHTNLQNQVDHDITVQGWTVRDINAAEDKAQLARVVADRLPELGIFTAAIALYQGVAVPTQFSRLIMACDPDGMIEIEPEGYLFPSAQLIPPEVLPRANWPLLTIHPLAARDIQFGYIILEMVMGNLSMFNTYITLSEQIGAALYRTLLQQQLKQTNIHLEQTARELTAANLQLTALNTALEEARQEAEKANTVKSQFLANMSHELRTPLNSIINFSKFVAKGFVGPVNQEQIETLEMVIASGNHLLSLINDVLDISKIESGSLRLFVEDDVDLDKEVQAAIVAGEALLEAKNKPVELIADIQPDLPYIVADKRRIRQIMLNLVSNACKFTDEGQVTVTLHQDGDNILFAVHDTGPGIAPGDHEAIFDTFHQTEVGLRQGEGTGLGLPISRWLAEIHGGHLWLESEPGHGSSFYASFPIRSKDLLSLSQGQQK